MDLSELDVLEDDDIIQNDDQNQNQGNEPEPPQNEEEENGEDENQDDDDNGGQQENNDENENQNDDENQNVDAIQEYLKSLGIEDPDKIKFENEDGQIEEKSWKDLTEDEKLNILKTQQSNDENELDDDEIDLINRIRLSNMSISDFVTAIKQQGANEYAQQLEQQNGGQQYTYVVDDLSDDELFMLDMQSRLGEDNITEDELKEALDTAKANEALFKKQIDGLRQEYKTLEDRRNEEEALKYEQQRQEEFETYSNNVINGINNFSSIGELNVTMDNNERQELYDFLTGADAAGINYFQKALADPDTLVRTAWFALHGEDVLRDISQYYNKQIQEVAKENYNKGLKDGKPKQEPKPKQSKVVVKPKSDVYNRVDVKKSIDDLDDLD